jgi:hypothetical protein
MKDESNNKPEKTEQQKDKNQVNQTNDLKKAPNDKEITARLHEICRALHRHAMLA